MTASGIRSQRGQALVGVMVVMLILFALAGAVAVGASTLLDDASRKSAVGDDLRVRSGVNDAVAQVAYSTSRCGAPPLPSPAASPTPVPTPLTVVLPPNGPPATAYCAREDAVVANSIRRLPGPSPTSICGAYPLGKAGASQIAVMFEFHTGQDGWAYVSNSSTPDSPCSWPLHHGIPSPPCSLHWLNVPALMQVALTCTVGASDQLWLHAYFDQGLPPPRIYVAAQDPAANPGSLYLLASPADPASSAFEESLLFVTADQADNRLLFEAPLP